MISAEDFKLAILKYECAISYHPFGHEPEPVFQCATPPVVYTVPKDHTSDPLEVAADVQAIVGERRACVLIPGTAFDVHGTRYGRGGGWYDRFLTAVPREWLRIGVCNDKEFSREPLARAPWDQPVDWVLVKTDGDWEFYKTEAR